MMLAYLMYVIAMDCKMPKALTFFFVANVVVFLYLFADFYRKAYKKQKKIVVCSPDSTNNAIKVD